MYVEFGQERGFRVQQKWLEISDFYLDALFLHVGVPFERYVLVPT